MLGHTFWDEAFSRTFLNILEREYNLPETADLLWESIYINHIDKLHMKIRRYSTDVVFEFDTLDELRQFDTTYVTDTRSEILKSVAKQLNCHEEDLLDVTAYKDETNEAAGFSLRYGNEIYLYSYKDQKLRRK